MKKQLLYEQNIRAAIVFLNMFGLSIEKREKRYSKDSLKITSLEGQEVGSLIMEEDKISIATKTDLGMLSAIYRPVTATLFRDLESIGSPRFAEWNTQIKYNIVKNEVEGFAGVLIADCSIDEEFGVKCLCRHTLDYLFNGIKTMSLRFAQNGELFGTDLWDGDRQESIKITPFDRLNGFIIHDIKKGKYGNNGFPYRKYSGIFSAGDQQKHQFRAFTITNEQGNDQDFKQIYYDKVGYKEDRWEDSRETIVQMGKVMHELDPDMYAKINDIKELLAMGETSLFDRLIAVSLEEFGDDEIEALLGITRKPLEYDGRLRQLKHLYFGPQHPFKITD